MLTKNKTQRKKNLSLYCVIVINVRIGLEKGKVAGFKSEAKLKMENAVILGLILRMDIS